MRALSIRLRRKSRRAGDGCPASELLMILPGRDSSPLFTAVRSTPRGSPRKIRQHSKGEETVADVLHATDAGAAAQATANIRHLSRMELPGGGQIAIQG